MTDQEFIKNLPNAEKFYAVFSTSSRMPYIECDEETYSDKTFLFMDEEQAKAFTEAYKAKKQTLVVATVEKANAKNFLASLIADGIDMISFQGEEVHDYPIDQIVTRTLREGVKAPIENPALQISLMYYLQNARIAETPEEKEELSRMEEEMMANIARAVYLVPFSSSEEVDDNGNQKVALMQLKNENDEIFIPLFSDLDEFLKMKPAEGKSQFLPMGFKQISNTKLNGINGFILNPASANIRLNEKNIAAVANRFGDQAK